MRTHVSAEQKAVRAEEGPAAPAVYGQPSAKPESPSVCSLAGSYKHAA